MESNNLKIPKLRFEGFNEEWCIKLLKNVFVKVTERNINNNHKNVFTNSAVSGIVNQLDFFDKDIANQNNLLNYYVVNTNDFIYNPRISKSAPVGPLKRNNLSKGIMSPLYTVIRTEEKNSDFFEKYFETKFWHRYMYKIANYGARFDRMNILSNDFFKMPLPFPDIKEQQKIASFLESVDSWINNLKEQKENLEKYKKGMMQKIFAQEIRFRDNNGKEFEEWKECTLSDLFKKYTDTIFVDNFTVYGQITISKKGLILKRGIKIGSQIGRKRQFVINLIKYPNTLTFIRQGIFDGAIGFIPKNMDKYIVTENMPLLSMNSKLLNKKFFKYLLKTRDYYKNVIFPIKPTGSAQTALHEKDWLKQKILIPEISEQQKIADFLTSIDNIISSKQEQIAKAEEWKKGLMQGLFV